MRYSILIVFQRPQGQNPVYQVQPFQLRQTRYRGHEAHKVPLSSGLVSFQYYFPLN